MLADDSGWMTGKPEVIVSSVGFGTDKLASIDGSSADTGFQIPAAMPTSRNYSTWKPDSFRLADHPSETLAAV
jgi:hypothetical protein